MTMDNDQRNTNTTPQVKICGLTDVEQALDCVALGADAIGCVFFPKSPRYVNEQRAGEICMALPKKIQKVGIFVNETFSTIMEKVKRCRLTAVQLHGQESPELVKKLKRENLLVIKALFIYRRPLLKQVTDYDADAFIIEYGKGTLPGGNALAWEWQQVGDFSKRNPLIVAGGLTHDNVYEAVRSCLPDAVDVSSGVESAPGIKDPAKVKSFMIAVSECADLLQSAEKKFKRIF